jgi:hypothetical protein
MGASKGKAIPDRESSDISAAPISESALQNDLISGVPGSGLLKMRLAGDKLSDIGVLNSIAEASQETKYSPENLTKAPSSQYLSYSNSSFRPSNF